MKFLCDENLFYIGGVVRDEILGMKSFDIDLTYVGDAVNFCQNLESQGLCKVIKINEPFGTARIIIKNREIDIASTRNEKYEKKGHLPTVTEIGCELKKDILRRDFTINSLAKSTFSNEVIDYTKKGLPDIKSKKLRVLHDESFIDDPTRIIRGLKFSVRFGFELEEHTKKLQENYLNNINYDMSYKRVKKELIETFNLNSQKAYNTFFTQKIYKLLTQKDITPLKYDIESLVNKYKPNNIWLVYLGWMDLSKIPLTREEQKIVDDYNNLKDIKIEEDDFSIYKAFSDKTKESILLYTISTNSKKGLRFFEIKNIKLDIDGNALKRLGIKPSKKYSDCFDYILKKKLENPAITKEQELELAKKFLLQ